MYKVTLQQVIAKVSTVQEKKVHTSSENVFIQYIHKKDHFKCKEIYP